MKKGKSVTIKAKLVPLERKIEKYYRELREMIKSGEIKFDNSIVIATMEDVHLITRIDLIPIFDFFGVFDSILEEITGENFEKNIVSSALNAAVKAIDKEMRGEK